VRKFLIKDSKDVFELKFDALREVENIKGIIDNYWAIVQNDGAVVTTEDFVILGTLLDQFVDSYEKIDELMTKVAEHATSNEIKNDK
jgi:hypothetical protein